MYPDEPDSVPWQPYPDCSYTDRFYPKHNDNSVHIFACKEKKQCGFMFIKYNFYYIATMHNVESIPTLHR